VVCYFKDTIKQATLQEKGDPNRNPWLAKMQATLIYIVVDRIKLRGLLLHKYKKTGDLDIVDTIKLHFLLGERHKYCQHVSISWPLNFKIKCDPEEDFEENRQP